MSISDMPTIKYAQNLGVIMDAAKEKIPEQFRIFDTYFMLLATIGGKLFTRQKKYLNRLHK